MNVDVEIFHFDLLAALEEKSQGIIKVIRIHPLGSMNVCEKLHASLSNSCGHISVQTKVVD